MTIEGMDPTLTSMENSDLDKVLEVAREHDPDVVAVFVLHGGPERGLALSAWTSLPGPLNEYEALGLVYHALENGEEPE